MGPYVQESLLTDARENYYVYDFDIHCDGPTGVPAHKCGMEVTGIQRTVAGIYSM
jgi:hypothetical protein